MQVIVWSDDEAGAGLGDAARALHPDGVAATVGAVVAARLPDAEVTVAGLHESDDGLPEARLAAADVLIWWGHEAHELVAEATVDRVQRHVLAGMGLIVLHSGHHSRIFRRLTGTTCDLSWREGEDEELVWTVEPGHPIAAGVAQPIVLGRHEMYGEPFAIPAPDELVFLSTFTGGEVFRSGCCFHRGAGRVFYFSPGHETFPVFDHPDVQRVIANAARWAAPPLRTQPVAVDGLPTTPIWSAQR